MKLGDFWFKHEEQSGEKISFQAAVTVTKDGSFFMTVPKEHEEELSHATGVELHRKQLRFKADSLDALTSKVQEALKQYLAYETKEEMVIRYNVRATCHYCIDKDGNVYPNGNFAKEATGRYHWAEAIGRDCSGSSYSEHDYSVSLMVQVCVKRTDTRGDMYKKVKYLPVYQPENNDSVGKYGTMLNGFCHIDVGDDSREVPYTEEAAKFFFVSMMSLCRLDASVQKFFADESKVLKLISSGDSMLLLGSNTEK